MRTGHEQHLLEAPLLVSGGRSLSDKGCGCSDVEQFIKFYQEVTAKLDADHELKITVQNTILQIPDLDETNFELNGLQ